MRSNLYLGSSREFNLSQHSAVKHPTHTSLGAFQKLCEYIVQRCDLRHITDSDPTTVSNATATNNCRHSTSLEPMREYKTFDFDDQINVSSETKVVAKCSTGRSRCGIMPSPTRALKSVLSITIPRSPLRLHLHDSYAPPPFPAKELPGCANEDNNTRQMLRGLVKRQASARELGVCE